MGLPGLELAPSLVPGVPSVKWAVLEDLDHLS